MAKFRKNFNAVMAVALIAGAFTVTSCRPNDDDYKHLDDLTAEVKSLEKEKNSLKSEKAKLERQIAEKQAKLDECAKAKAATKENLSKIGK
ncbi:MAG: hypothetical protein ACEPO8_05495 [Rhodothermaceae bacterium]